MRKCLPGSVINTEQAYWNGLPPGAAPTPFTCWLLSGINDSMHRRHHHTGLGRVVAEVKNALLSTLFVLLKDHHEYPPVVSVFALFVKT